MFTRLIRRFFGSGGVSARIGEVGEKEREKERARSEFEQARLARFWDLADGDA